MYVKLFNVNMRGVKESAIMQANAWLAKYPDIKVISTESWEGFPPGWDDYWTKVTLICDRAPEEEAT